MQTVVINAVARENTGSKGVKQVRSNDLIPAVVYGGGEVSHISVDFKELRDAIYTPEFKVVDLQLNGSGVQCIVRDVQFHPVSEEILHVDFLRLTPGQPVKVDVPVRFVGTSPGVRGGGKLIQKIRRLSIKTTPEELVDELLFDISNLTLGHSIRVKDAQIDGNIEVLNSPNIPVASVQIPRALKGADAEEEGESEAEGEEGEGGEGEGSKEGEEGKGEE